MEILRQDLASRQKGSVHRLPFDHRGTSPHHCCPEKQFFSSFQRLESGATEIFVLVTLHIFVPVMSLNGNEVF